MLSGQRNDKPCLDGYFSNPDAMIEIVGDLLSTAEDPEHTQQFMALTKGIINHGFNQYRVVQGAMPYSVYLSQISMEKLICMVLTEVSAQQEPAYRSLKASIVSYIEYLCGRPWQDILTIGIPREAWIKHNSAVDLL